MLPRDTLITTLSLSLFGVSALAGCAQAPRHSERSQASLTSGVQAIYSDPNGVAALTKRARVAMDLGAIAASERRYQDAYDYYLSAKRSVETYKRLHPTQPSPVIASVEQQLAVTQHVAQAQALIASGPLGWSYVIAFGSSSSYAAREQLLHLAEIYGELGQTERARRMLSQAQAAIQSKHDSYYIRRVSQVERYIDAQELPAAARAARRWCSALAPCPLSVEAELVRVFGALAPPMLHLPNSMDGWGRVQRLRTLVNQGKPEDAFIALLGICVEGDSSCMERVQHYVELHADSSLRLWSTPTILFAIARQQDPRKRLDLAWDFYWMWARAGDEQRAQEWLNGGLATVISQLPKHEDRVLHRLGAITRQVELGLKPEARRALDALLKENKAQPLSKTTAQHSFIRRVASIYISLGAEDEAIALFEALPHTNIRADLAVTLMLTSAERAETSRLNLLTELNSPERELDAYARLAAAYAERGKPQIARKMIEGALAAEQRLGVNDEFAAHLELDLATACAKLEMWPQAQALQERSISRLETAKRSRLGFVSRLSMWAAFNHEHQGGQDKLFKQRVGQINAQLTELGVTYMAQLSPLLEQLIDSDDTATLTALINALPKSYHESYWSNVLQAALKQHKKKPLTPKLLKVITEQLAALASAESVYSSLILLVKLGVELKQLPMLVEFGRQLRLLNPGSRADSELRRMALELAFEGYPDEALSLYDELQAPYERAKLLKELASSVSRFKSKAQGLALITQLQQRYELMLVNDQQSWGVVGLAYALLGDCERAAQLFEQAPRQSSVDRELERAAERCVYERRPVEALTMISRIASDQIKMRVLARVGFYFERSGLNEHPAIKAKLREVAAQLGPAPKQH